MHKIGILSDTHGLLRPEVLAGCDRHTYYKYKRILRGEA